MSEELVWDTFRLTSGIVWYRAYSARCRFEVYDYTGTRDQAGWRCQWSVVFNGTYRAVTGSADTVREAQEQALAAVGVMA